MKVTQDDLSKLHDLIFRYGALPDTNDPKDVVMDQRISQLYVIVADLNARLQRLETPQ